MQMSIFFFVSALIIIENAHSSGNGGCDLRLSKGQCAIIDGRELCAQKKDLCLRSIDGELKEYSPANSDANRKRIDAPKD